MICAECEKSVIRTGFQDETFIVCHKCAIKERNTWEAYQEEIQETINKASLGIFMKGDGSKPNLVGLLNVKDVDTNN